MCKIAIIIPYIGKFKESINLFLESCKRNSEIDWFIFTNNTEPDGLSSNIHWEITSLREIKKLAEFKLQAKVNLERAYKLCDLKAFYGLIFEDFIKNYDYWGYGDVDVIYGHIFNFLNKINLKKYDKINSFGHLCLIRNNEQINKICLSNTPNTKNFEEILESENNLGYDEHDLNSKFLFYNSKIYDGIFSADIDCIYDRMRCVDKNTIKYFCGIKRIQTAPKNYKYQLFLLNKGGIFRYYISHNTIKKDEFAYIHFRKEVPVLFKDKNMDSFLITRKCFMPLDGEILLNKKKFKEFVIKYNKSKILIEKLKFIYVCIRCKYEK